MPLVRTALLLLGLAALAAAVAWSDPTGTVPRMYLPAPEHLTRKRQIGGPGFSVTYLNGAPAQTVQDAVQFAFNILENTFVLTQPIYVRFEFARLGWDPTKANILGAASANQFSPCPPPAATTKLYASALYKQLFNVSVVPYSTQCSQAQAGNGQTWDILARFNSDAPFSFSGNPTTSQYDFVYTFLHEMFHGLGFSGGIQQSGTSLVNAFASWAGSPISGAKVAAAYDFLVTDVSGQKPVNAWLTNGDTSTWTNAYNKGALTLATTFSDAPASQVYTPRPYVPGSSWYHLSLNYLGTSNQMMTPSLSPGSIIHTPGVLTLRVMEQMGWTLQSSAIPTAQQASTLTGSSGSRTTSGGNTAVAVASAPFAALIALLLALAALLL